MLTYQYSIPSEPTCVRKKDFCCRSKMKTDQDPSRQVHREVSRCRYYEGRSHATNRKSENLKQMKLKTSFQFQVSICRLLHDRQPARSADKGDQPDHQYCRRAEGKIAKRVDNRRCRTSKNSDNHRRQTIEPMRLQNSA